MSTASTQDGMGYREIADVLMHEIQRGTWPAGEQLPPETELGRRFGASRNTVRESLRCLDRQGYIRRRRGARSTVVSTTPIESFVNSIESIDDMMHYSTRTVPQIVAVDMIVAGEELSERLGVPLQSRWLRVQLLRLTHGSRTPVGYSETYIHPDYASITERLSESQPLYRMLAEQFQLNYARVEQMIEATAASPAVASLLGVAQGSAIMLARTEFVTETQVVAEIAFGHFPAKRYRMEIALERCERPAGA